MRQTHKKIGQVKFFQACEVLRTYREEIEKTCTNAVQAAGFISQKIGGNVSSKSTFPDIMEATGITLTFARKPTGGDTSAKSAKDKAIIVAAVAKLSEEMGVVLSQEFADLYQRAFNKPYRAVSSIPVSSIPPTSTLPITKKA